MADVVQAFGPQNIPVKFVDNGDGSYSISTTGAGGGGGGGGDASAANQATQITASNLTNTRVGDLTEASPGTDTASSGLNGRLQRIAQRLSSLIALWAAGAGTAAAALRTTLANDDPAVVSLAALNTKAQANYLAYASTAPTIATAALSVVGVYDVRGYSVFWMRAQNTGSTALADLTAEEGPTSAGPWTEVVTSWGTLTDGKLMSWAVTSGTNPAVAAASATFVIRLDIAGAPFIRIRARQATSNGSLAVDAAASRF